MAKIKDVTNVRFGRLIATEFVGTEKGIAVWRCKCDCGNTICVNQTYLYRKRVESCGCLKAEKEAEKAKKPIKSKVAKDITGQRFGRLVAIEPTHQRKSAGQVVWKCKCDCGNEVSISVSNLTQGIANSCGCYRNELARKLLCVNGARYKKENYVAGTRLDVVNKQNKMYKNNTSGYTGVVYNKKDQRYAAVMQFQNKKYYLGSHKELEKAIEIRKKGEEKLYGDFLQWYNSLKNPKE